jgi:hypothetical protein
MRESFLAAAPFIAAFYFVFFVFMVSVMVAASSYAYKALKGYDTMGPIPQPR